MSFHQPEVAMSELTGVVIIERRTLVREGLIRLLSEAGCVVELAADSFAALEGLQDRLLGMILVVGQSRDECGDVGAGVRRVTVRDGVSLAGILGELALDYSVPAIPPPERSARPVGDAHSYAPRERQILKLIGEGLSARQIATSLGVSASTVEHHKQQLFLRVGVQSQAHAVALSLRQERLQRTAS